MSRLLACALIAGLSAAGVSTSAIALDAAAVWRDGCSRCHGADAAIYARAELRIVSGKLTVTDKGVTVAAFLANGHGRLATEDVKDMEDYLTKLVAPN